MRTKSCSAKAGRSGLPVNTRSVTQWEQCWVGALHGPGRGLPSVGLAMPDQTQRAKAGCWLPETSPSPLSPLLLSPSCPFTTEAVQSWALGLGGEWPPQPLHTSRSLQHPILRLVTKSSSTKTCRYAEELFRPGDSFQSLWSLSVGSRGSLI